MFSSQSENDLVECPYDNTHRILRKRLQIHLLRCRKTHPDAELQKCPFNAVHLIPEPEYVHHVSSCPDRKLLTQYKYNPGEKPVEHEIIRHEKIEDEENWDEMEINAPDFKPNVFSGRHVKREEKDIIEEPVSSSSSSRSRSRSCSRPISRPRTRSRSRSRPISRPRTRSRSPSHPAQSRYPLVQPKREIISPPREYIPPKRNYILPRREIEQEYVVPQREVAREYIVPKREILSPPPMHYPYYAPQPYRHHRQHLPAPSPHYRNFRNNNHIKREPPQTVEYYDLDDDPYYNGGL